VTALAFRRFFDSAQGTVDTFQQQQRRSQGGDGAQLSPADVLATLADIWRGMDRATREAFLEPARALLHAHVPAPALAPAPSALAGRKRTVSEGPESDGGGGGGDGPGMGSPGGESLSGDGSPFLQSPKGEKKKKHREEDYCADVPAWEGGADAALVAAQPRLPQVTDVVRAEIAADGLVWSASHSRCRCRGGAGKAPRPTLAGDDGDDSGDAAAAAAAEADLNLYLATAAACVERHQRRRKAASQGAAYEPACSAVDAAMAVLHLHGYDAAAALDAVAGDAFADAVLAEWTLDDQQAMWGAFARYGDDLARLVAALAPRQGQRAVVEYYFQHMYGAVQLQSPELEDAPALPALCVDDDGATDISRGDDRDDDEEEEGEEVAVGVNAEREEAFLRQCRAAMDAAAVDKLTDVMKNGMLRVTAMAVTVRHLLQQAAGDQADALFREFVATFLPATAATLILSK
jgi:hypothetical protein